MNWLAAGTSGAKPPFSGLPPAPRSIRPIRRMCEPSICWAACSIFRASRRIHWPVHSTPLSGGCCTARLAAAATGRLIFRPMWGSRSRREMSTENLGDINLGNTRKDASIFLGIDTFLGPVYLATGYEEHGRRGVLPVPGPYLQTTARPAMSGPITARTGTTARDFRRDSRFSRSAVRAHPWRASTHGGVSSRPYPYPAPAAWHTSGCGATRGPGVCERIARRQADPQAVGTQ